MQGFNSTLSASTEATLATTSAPPIPDTVVNKKLRNRMKHLEISPQSPFSGSTGPSSISKASRRRARIDQPWKKSTSSSREKPNLNPIKGMDGGVSGIYDGGVGANLGEDVVGNGKCSRVAASGMEGNGRRGNRGHGTERRGGGRRGGGRRRKGEERSSYNNPADNVNGRTNVPKERRNDGIGRARRHGPGKRAFTTRTLDGVQDQARDNHYRHYQNLHENRQPMYTPPWSNGHGSGSRMIRNSLLQGIQSQSMQPAQLTHLTLLRYEFLMDEFLELMYLLPSLQVLDIEIISLLSLGSLSRSQCTGTCDGTFQDISSLSMQDGSWGSSQESQDDDRMLVDQDDGDQTQWESGSQPQSQSDISPDNDESDGLQPCGCYIRHLQSQHQFLSVRSLTFRGPIVIPGLLAFFPNLEILELEGSRYHPPLAPLHSDHSGCALFNSPAKGSSNARSSPYGSEYNSSSFHTDSDNDSLDATARMVPPAAIGQCNLPAMMSELAHTLMDSCPRLSRLVLNEPSLIDDLNPEPQQLTHLLRAVPQLQEFVVHMCVVARCPELLETLTEYQHPHLTSFQVLDDGDVDRSTSQQQQPLYQGQQSLSQYQHAMLLQQSLEHQQQQQHEHLKALDRLRKGCFTILECCPQLQVFESKVPLPLQDLIASVPRWACGSSLTVLKLEIQELTCDGGLDPEEEEVMQMFVKSLFFGGHSHSGGNGDDVNGYSPSSSTTAAAATESSQSQSSDSSSTPYPSSESSSFPSLSTSETSGSRSGVSGSGSGSSPARSGSASGSVSSGSDSKSGSLSSPSRHDSSSSHSSSRSKPKSRSRSKSHARLPPPSHRRTSSGAAGGGDPLLDTPSRMSSSSPSSSSTSSMSVSPPILSMVKESVPLEDESEATNGSSGSDQSSVSSGRPHHHRHQHQRPLIPPHFQQRDQDPPSYGQSHNNRQLPLPPPPPRRAPSPTSTASFLNACQSYYQIEAVGRLVALQFLVEHQLVYLPKLDQFFLGNRMYKIPTRNHGMSGIS
ncbi:MAG: hypothetical protein J3Q66DRAFT_47078 [Benniella sp.]|nr:MAG: hypothetical protein J3Q66DRAFT_47078 [Benniella sp.]